MFFNIKRVFATIFCTVFIFGFSMASMVTAEVNPIVGSDSDTFIKLVHDEGEHEHSGEGEPSDEEGPSEEGEQTVFDLDIKFDLESNELIYGSTWENLTEEQMEEFQNFAKDIEVQELTIQELTINAARIPTDPNHLCTFCWWDPVLRRLKCVPPGCERWSH